MQHARLGTDALLHVGDEGDVSMVVLLEELEAEAIADLTLENGSDLAEPVPQGGLCACS